MSAGTAQDTLLEYAKRIIDDLAYTAPEAEGLQRAKVVAWLNRCATEARDAARAEGEAKGFAEGVEASAKAIEAKVERLRKHAAECSVDAHAQDYLLSARRQEGLLVDIRALVPRPAEANSQPSPNDSQVRNSAEALAKIDAELNAIAAGATMVATAHESNGHVTVKVERRGPAEATASEPARCQTKCDHGSQCIKGPGHPGGHNTEHGCICYDPRDLDKGRATDGLDLDALSALEREATNAPWTPHTETYRGYVDLWHSLEAPLSRGSLDWSWIESSPSEMKLFPVVTGNGPTSKANAALVAALRNAAPELIRRARERDELVGDGAEYILVNRERERAEKAERERDALAFEVGQAIGLRSVDFAAGEDTAPREHAIWHAVRETMRERDEARAALASAKEWANEAGPALDVALRERDELREALSALAAKCPRCSGVGVEGTYCRRCRISHFEHEHEEIALRCQDARCVEARAALAKLEAK